MALCMMQNTTKTEAMYHRRGYARYALLLLSSSGLDNEFEGMRSRMLLLGWRTGLKAMQVAAAKQLKCDAGGGGETIEMRGMWNNNRDI